MKNYTTELLKIDGIAGVFYKVPNRSTNKIVIYGVGAPVPPDCGKLTDAPYILDFNVDLFVPDYIGYGRNDGRFTPLNCIKTFLKLHSSFTTGCNAISSYKKINLKLQYDTIFFIGRSFAGAYLPLLPKYNKDIQNICIIFPVTDFTKQGKISGEETLGNFMKAMNLDGYKYLYRGIMSNTWRKHFKNEDTLSPIKNIHYLKNCILFIGHGKQDVNIHYSQSEIYYKSILKHFPDRKSQFTMKLYPKGDHSIKTTRLAIRDYLKWVDA